MRYMSTTQNEIFYNFFMELKLRLKELRCEYGKTQTELARTLNIKQNTYSQYETGQRQLPLEVLVQLSEIYGVSTDYILGLTDIET